MLRRGSGKKQRRGGGERRARQGRLQALSGAPPRTCLELRLGDFAAPVQVEGGEGVPDGLEQFFLQAPHGPLAAAPSAPLAVSPSWRGPQPVRAQQPNTGGLRLGGTEGGGECQTGVSRRSRPRHRFPCLRDAGGATSEGRHPPSL